MNNQRPRFAVIQLIALAIGVQLSGCAAYRMGNATLYAPDIQTVYVPMFESDSFRPALGERLTEAVVKEIQLKTNYQVVNSIEADSVLSGKIVQDTKRVTVENAQDETRELDINLQVEVVWVNRRREPIRDPTMIPIPPEMLTFGQSSRLIPEVGQSVAFSQQQVIQRLAEQIVAAMEEPW